MRFIDWFAGIGGFRRGLELAGHKCVGFCEYDPYAVASYTAMHLITKEQAHYLKSLSLKQRQKEILKEEYRNGEWYAKDITEVRGADIPEADIWCGGFPCQDLSIAGHQRGLKGERSNLFFQFVRCLKEKEEGDRPEWVILENVKNLLSINGGWDFARVLFALGKAGYNCSWQVFNSKDHGVPQNRERVYIVGHIRGKRGRKVFPVAGTGGENSVPGINQIGEGLEDARSQSYRVYGTDGNVAALAARDYKWPKLVPAPITRIGHSKCYRRSYQIFDPCGPVEAIDTGQGGGRHPYVGIKVIGSTPLAFGIDKNVNGKEREIANTLTAREDRGVSNHHREGTAIAIPVSTPEIGRKNQNDRRIKENGDPSFTLTARDRHGVAIGFNTMPDGSCRTIKNQYQKNSAANFKSSSGSRAATAVAVTMDAPKQGDGIFVETEQGFTVYAVWYEKYSCYIAIRKLTPKECFRLQGWEDKYFNRASYFNSDSQLYKQAGNGVTVNVVKIIGERIK